MLTTSSHKATSQGEATGGVEKVEVEGEGEGEAVEKEEEKVEEVVVEVAEVVVAEVEEEAEEEAEEMEGMAETEVVAAEVLPPRRPNRCLERILVLHRLVAQRIVEMLLPGPGLPF